MKTSLLRYALTLGLISTGVTACHTPTTSSTQVATSPLVTRLQRFHDTMQARDYQKTYQQNYLANFASPLNRSVDAFRIQSGSISSFVEDFSTATANFGDGSDGWTEWGGNYYRDPNGAEAITLGNPQTQTGVLQTGFYKTIPITAQAGDTLIAKMSVATTFTSNSDTTLVLSFNDPNNTVIATDTARGNLAGDQILFAETLIPAGATEVTIAPLVYLAQDEQSSLLIHDISVEQIPAGYYTKTTLLNEPLDDKGTNAYGTNSPLGVDEEFGYDFYVVDNYPLKYTGDGAVTTWNPGPGNHSSPEGGLVKRIDINNLQPGESVTAMLYAAPTFDDATSFTLFSVQFFDASDTLLQQLNSVALRGGNYKWLIMDRAPIPTGTAYIKLAPTVKLGTTETSSLLWDELRLYRYTVNGSASSTALTGTVNQRP